MIIGKNSIQANIKINYFLKFFMNVKAYCIFQELLTISNDLNENFNITVSDLFKISKFNYIKNLQFNFFVIHFCQNDFFANGM